MGLVVSRVGCVTGVNGMAISAEGTKRDTGTRMGSDGV
jgi:hypothetical protein